MDSGIWATWYNIDEADQEDYLVWLHAEYLPWLRQRSGYCWVAHYVNEGGGHDMRALGKLLPRSKAEVPSGMQFLQLAGAASPHNFFTPNVLEPHGPPAFAHQLAKRREVVSNVFMEEARVNGPEAGQRAPGAVPGPAIQMGSFRIDTIDNEFKLGAWYAQYRLPQIAATPGAICARKLISVAGWAKHSILYEFVSLEARLRHFEVPQEKLALNPDEWTGKIVLTTIHTPGSPVVARRTWPPVAQV
jgi:hypothetical protein